MHLTSLGEDRKKKINKKTIICKSKTVNVILLRDSDSSQNFTLGYTLFCFKIFLEKIINKKNKKSEKLNYFKIYYS